MARMNKTVILLVFLIYPVCVSKVRHRLSLGLTLALPRASSSLRLFVCRRLVSLLSLLTLPRHFFHHLSFKYSLSFFYQPKIIIPLSEEIIGSRDEKSWDGIHLHGNLIFPWYRVWLHIDEYGRSKSWGAVSMRETGNIIIRFTRRWAEESRHFRTVPD